VCTSTIHTMAESKTAVAAALPGNLSLAIFKGACSGSTVLGRRLVFAGGPGGARPAHATGNVRWDVAASAMIGVLLEAIAVSLAMANDSLLTAPQLDDLIAFLLTGR
jgi:hypothetical protein